MRRRVLITGASRGIGRAIALNLAQSGFDLILNFLQNVEAAGKVQQQCQSHGAQVDLLPFDVTDRSVSQTHLQAVLKQYGALYGVVLNAGVVADSPFPALGGEQWDRVLATDLGGFYNVLQPLIMPMIQARSGGRIVTISSISGLIGNRGQVNYSAAKAGLIGATKALSLELAKRQITVNCVAPGIIATDLTSTLPEEEVLKLIPAKRLGRPEEVAGLVGYLFSDLAAYITGQVISINGGMI